MARYRVDSAYQCTSASVLCETAWNKPQLMNERGNGGQKLLFGVSYCFLCSILFLLVLEMVPGVLCMLGKHSAPELPTPNLIPRPLPPCGLIKAIQLGRGKGGPGPLGSAHLLNRAMYVKLRSVGVC